MNKYLFPINEVGFQSNWRQLYRIYVPTSVLYAATAYLAY